MADISKGRTDPALAAIIPAGNVLGESPVWDDDAGRLRWLDCARRELWSLDPATGATAALPLSGHAGSFGLAAPGGAVAATDTGFARLDLATGALTPIAGAQPEAARPEHRFNDGKVAPDGSFWAGSKHKSYGRADGRLYRLAADGAVSVLADAFKVPNGPAWSPDGGTFYMNDSPVGMFAWTLRDGGLAERRPVAADIGLPGHPDGSAVDAVGCLWNARWDGGAVVRLTADGRLDRVIELPAARITSCAFGGAKLDRLFVTSARIGLSDNDLAATPDAGALFVLDVGVSGHPVARFG